MLDISRGLSDNIAGVWIICDDRRVVVTEEIRELLADILLLEMEPFLF